MPKAARDQFRALPLEFPGRESIALPQGDAIEEYSCVSIYAAVPGRSGLAGLVRVNLFASLLNVRSLVASAVIPVNFSGPVIAASGILADCYSVYLQATNPELDVYISIRADTCCAEPKVTVPVALQNPVIPEDLPEGAELVEAPFAPWQVETGRYLLFTEVNTPLGVVDLPLGVRVLSLYARAGAGAATVEIAGPDGAPAVMGIEPNEAIGLQPNGALSGPLTITFTDVVHFAVETVR